MLRTEFSRWMLDLKTPEVNVSARYWDMKKATARVISERFTSSTPSGPRTAVIPIIGPLNNDTDVCYYGGTSYPEIQAAVDDAVNDPTIGEILLLVDSPGGGVQGLPETADMLFKARSVKPVNAMVTGDAASAAFYLVSQASNITASPSAEVGSVGVLMMHADISKMLADAGITVTMIHAGKYKTELWPYAPLTDEAKAAAQATIDDLYAGFLSAVARGRGSRVSPAMTKNNYGEGRMMSAKDAYAGGLVDNIQSMREYLQEKTAKRVTPGHNANLLRKLDLEGMDI
jgi:signal peptide peptidase SppA